MATCTLTFMSTNGDVALVASTCREDAALAPGQSCTLTFAVSPTVSTTGEKGQIAARTRSAFNGKYLAIHGLKK